MSKELIEVVVTAVMPAGRDNLLFELRLPDSGQLPPFQAGAHIDVHLKNGLIRQYSLCSHPLNNDHYQLCVQLDGQSRGGSAAMHKEVKAGQRLLISYPRNNFPLPPAVRYLLFAGGIGITPLLPMAEMAHHLGSAFELHYYTSHAEQKALTDRLNALNDTGVNNIFFHDSAAGNSLRRQLPECLRHPDSQSVIISCGPPGFMQRLKEAAGALGWQKSQFYSEQFQNSGAVLDKGQALNSDPGLNRGPGLNSGQPADTEDVLAANSKDSFSVQIASTGAIYRIGKQETIADVLIANGVAVELSCEQGMCGACLTRVLSGIPEHHDIVQSDEEKEKNDYMTLCCSRSMSDLLILDL